MNKIIKEKGAKAPNSLAMEEMLNGVKQIIDLRMFDYNKMVENNNPSEEKRVEALCSIADALIGIGTHIKDKMPNFEFVFDGRGKTVEKNVWLGKKNETAED